MFRLWAAYGCVNQRLREEWEFLVMGGWPQQVFASCFQQLDSYSVYMDQTFAGTRARIPKKEPWRRRRDTKEDGFKIDISQTKKKLAALSYNLWQAGN